MDQNQLKELVGREAVKFIEGGMIVGLGTGSTVKYMIDALGERVKNEGLSIVGVATSDRSAKQAESLGIEVKQLDDVDHIDLTIDGADESVMISKALRVAVRLTFGKRSLPLIQRRTFGLLTKARWFTLWASFHCHLK